MANIKLEHIKKIYKGNKNFTVVDFNLEVEDKEFVVLVGGSGCGKSTTLRMIAGLEDISDGKLYFDDTVMNDVSTGQRNIAMVFQSYALYPHMTVFKNISFPLVIHKKNIRKEIETQRVAKENAIALDKKLSELKVLKSAKPKKGFEKQYKKAIKEKEFEIRDLKIKVKDENPLSITKEINETIKTRVTKVAKIVGLENLLHRKPKQLSGGQRQRVALARSIVKGNIKVLLMDEPLSNLDAKLRVEMRSSIIKLHEELGLTIIYVTHDQVEAMTMANKIVVMNQGIVQQTGSPKEIYEYPHNLFVASFIGTPSMNFMKGTINNGNFIIDDNTKVAIPKDQYDNLRNKNYDGKEVIMGIRPGDIKISNDMKELSGEVEVLELLGDDYNLHVVVGPYRIVVRTKADKFISNHEIINLDFEMDKAHFFDIDSLLRIRGQNESELQ